MASPRKYIRSFSEFRGINLRASDLINTKFYATGGKNFSFTKAIAVEKRKGFQFKTESFGGYGLSRYDDIDATTGIPTVKLIAIDDSLYKLTDNSFTVSYSGSNISLLDIKLNSSSKFQLDIKENESSILSQNLGIGLDEASATTIATVVSTINGLTDYTCTLSSGSIDTGSAAFIDLVEGKQLSATAYTVNYKVWTLVNEPTASPLSTFVSKKNNTDFENASTIQMQNVLYISTGHDNLMKYDGQNFYRAGMPAGGDADGSGDSGTAPTLADAAGGTTFAAGEYYNYFILYKQVDNKGNIIEGIPSPYSSEKQGNSKDIDVTTTNLTSGGFNLNYAIVNGAQSGVTTITVDDGSGGGHSLLVGDTAYFYDDNTNAYVTKEITAVTSTSITFSGSVDVSDNYVISNNLRIGIYRTKDKGGTTSDENTRTYFLVDEIPNDPSNSTQTYTDSTTDANIGAEYIVPLKSHGLPPKGSYCTKFQNHLIIAGKKDDVNNWFYSDIDSPEYFPAGTNQSLVDAFPGSKIKGLGALDTALIIFKDRSIVTVSGELGEDSFKQDEVSSGDIGCSAHATIKRIGNSLFFLSRKGVYSLNSEMGAQYVGSPLDPEFTDFDVTFNFNKAVAEHWQDRDKYILFMPNESQDGSSNYYANSTSKVYVYDYALGSWFIWDSLNMQGGIVDLDGALWFTPRKLDSDSSAIEFQSAVFNDYGNKLDYSDHQSAISFEYKSHWETLGAPELFKRALRLKTYSLPNDISNSEAPLFTLNCEFEFDFNAPGTIFELDQDFSGGTSGWGNGQWGLFPWGDNALPEIKSKLKSSKMRAIRTIFKNEVVNENVLISGYELEFIAPFKPRMK